MIGVLGGSFDPVHYGHLRCALEISTALQLQQVRFIPGGIPPHREVPMANSDQRIAMLELALANTEIFVVDDSEIRREGASYTVTTLESLKAETGGSAICLLLGVDAFAGLPSWYEWQRLFELAHIVVMQRPGAGRDFENVLQHEVESRQAEDLQELQASHAGRILFCRVSQLDISSSAIRQMLAEGISPRYLLPDGVLEHIHSNRIYI